MSCDPYREALSAQVDGEEIGMPVDILEAHVRTCAACQAWAANAARATRALRIRRPDPVPDLEAPILATLAAARRAATAPARGRQAPSIIRLTLALVAAAQALVALPALLGNDLGAPIHVAHEQGAWALGLAAALAFAAWKPQRAAGMLPMLVPLVGVLALISASDIATGRAVPTTELPHLMSAVGLMLLWLAAHPPRALTAARAPAVTSRPVTA